MRSRTWSRRVRAWLVLGVAFGVLVLSYALAEFAFTWFGSPCECTPMRYLGEVCLTRCMSLGPLTLTEGPTTVVLLIAVPAAGSALAGWLLGVAGPRVLDERRTGGRPPRGRR